MYRPNVLFHVILFLSIACHEKTNSSPPAPTSPNTGPSANAGGESSQGATASGNANSESSEESEPPMPVITEKEVFKAKFRVPTLEEGFIAQTLAVQRDGNLLVGGCEVARVSHGQRLVLMRLSPDGEPDPQFTRTRIQYECGRVEKIVQLNSGKILVVGRHSMSGSGLDEFDGVHNGFVARILSNGGFDTSFGSSGKLNFDMYSGNLYDPMVTAFVQQPDGKFLFGGLAANRSERGLTLIRLNDDGTFDSGFGTEGVATIYHEAISSAPHASYVENSHFGAVRSLWVASSGHIFVSAIGNYLFPGDLNSDDIILFRVNSNGTLDTSFGEEGMLPELIYGRGSHRVIGGYGSPDTFPRTYFISQTGSEKRVHVAYNPIESHPVTSYQFSLRTYLLQWDALNWYLRLTEIADLGTPGYGEEPRAFLLAGVSEDVAHLYAGDTYTQATLSSFGEQGQVSVPCIQQGRLGQYREFGFNSLVVNKTQREVWALLQCDGDVSQIVNLTY